MQGLWSTQRRNKLNLNSPALSAPSTPATPSADESQIPGPAGPSTEPLIDSPVIVNGDADVENSPAVAGKRKLRSSRAVESSSKRSKTAVTSTGTPAKDHSPPTARLSDLGGVESCIEKMLELVAMPLCHPEVYLHTGVQPPRGVLLHGPPGCGKTLLAHAMAGVSSVLFFINFCPDDGAAGTRCPFY